jgi:hypothetical protein
MSLLDELKDEIDQQNEHHLHAIRTKVRDALKRGWSMSRVGFTLVNSPQFVHKLFDPGHAFLPSTLAVVYNRLELLDQPVPQRRRATERYLTP